MRSISLSAGNGKDLRPSLAGGLHLVYNAWHREASSSRFRYSVLPDPDMLAAEIVEDLQAALEQFREIAEDLAR